MTVQNNATLYKKKQQTISMPAAQEAKNNVAVTLINVNATRDGLTGASAATRLAYCCVAKGMKTFYIRRLKSSSDALISH